MKHKHRVLFLVRAGVIAGLYVALTLLSGAMGLAFGPVQFRLSEGLIVLVAFFPEAVPGMTLGCLISSFFGQSGAGMLGDMVFGTLATFIGAYFGRKLRNRRWLFSLPNVIANGVIIPFVLAFAYGARESIPFLILTVTAGEVGVCYLCALPLMRAIQPIAARLGGDRYRSLEERSDGK